MAKKAKERTTYTLTDATGRVTRYVLRKGDTAPEGAVVDDAPLEQRATAQAAPENRARGAAVENRGRAKKAEKPAEEPTPEPTPEPAPAPEPGA